MMIIAQRNLLKLKVESLSDAEVLEVLEYISITEALHSHNTGLDPLDELLLRLLSDAQERVPQEGLRQ